MKIVEIRPSREQLAGAIRSGRRMVERLLTRQEVTLSSCSIMIACLRNCYCSEVEQVLSGEKDDIEFSKIFPESISATLVPNLRQAGITTVADLLVVKDRSKVEKMVGNEEKAIQEIVLAMYFDIFGYGQEKLSPVRPVG